MNDDGGDDDGGDGNDGDDDHAARELHVPARQQGHQGAAEARQQTKSIYRGVEVGGVQRLVVNGGTMVPPPVPAQRRPNLRLALVRPTVLVCPAPPPWARIPAPYPAPSSKKVFVPPKRLVA